MPLAWSPSPGQGEGTVHSHSRPQPRQAPRKLPECGSSSCFRRHWESRAVCTRGGTAGASFPLPGASSRAGETEAQTRHQQSKHQFSCGTAWYPALGVPGWKGVGWPPAPEMGGGLCRLWQHNVPHGHTVATRGCGMGAPGAQEPGEGLAPLSPGVSAPGGVPGGQRRGNAPFQQHPALGFSSGVPSTGGSLQGGTLTSIPSPPVTAGDPRPGPLRSPPAPPGPLLAPPRAGTHGSLAPEPLGPAASPGRPHSGSSPGKAPPRVLPASRRGGASTRSDLCPGSSGNRPGPGTPRTGIPGRHQPCPTLAGSSNPAWGLRPSPSIPNSATNLPLHRARGW